MPKALTGVPLKIVQSRYLDDGKGFNDGRPVTLIAVENQADHDALIANMAAAGYYDGDYLEHNLGYGSEKVKMDNLLLAAVLDFLEPASVLEIGCGKADVPFLLRLRGKAQVRGLDFSERILAHAPPETRACLDCGDLVTVRDRYLNDGLVFDTVCGFDIWEHLHPARLDEHIAATVELSREDALFFYIIPAFGRDRIFGEVFPLEFEENRASFDRPEPFTHLVAERLEPPIPQSGHLIWAPAPWWEQRFAAHGLRRVEVLERNVHQYFDRHFNRAARSFFILRKDTQPASARVARLARHPLTPFKTWQLLHIYLRAVRIHERKHGVELMDWEKMLWLEDGALETMLAGFEDQLRRPWPLGLLKTLRDRLLRRPPAQL